MSFSIGEAVGFGWKTTKENFWSLFLIFLTVVLVTSVIPNILGESVSKINFDELPLAAASFIAFSSFIFSAAFYVVSLVVDMGLIKISLNYCNGGKAKVADLFSVVKPVFRYIGAIILYSLLIILGLVLFVVPGIIWALKYMFFSYFIIDKNMKPTEALGASAKITEGNKRHLALFVLALFGINILGAMALIIGLFFTIPLSMISMAFVYKKLSTASQ